MESTHPAAAGGGERRAWWQITNCTKQRLLLVGGGAAACGEKSAQRRVGRARRAHMATSFAPWWLSRSPLGRAARRCAAPRPWRPPRTLLAGAAGATPSAASSLALEASSLRRSIRPLSLAAAMARGAARRTTPCGLLLKLSQCTGCVRCFPWADDGLARGGERLVTCSVRRRGTSSPAMQLGFLGLGIMGARMAERLVQAGCTLRVWNRSADKVHQQPKPAPARRACAAPLRCAVLHHRTPMVARDDMPCVPSRRLASACAP